MYVLTNKQMRNADEYTIKRLGTPSLGLMERAGHALADEAERLAPTGKILCVCGGGNNGGDGFVCARLLKGRGRVVTTVCFADKYSGDCLVNKEKWLACGGENFTDFSCVEGCSIVVDCLFGTGFHGSVDGENARAVSWMNKQKRAGVKILSADISSGLCGDNGLAKGEAVCADVTLCIGEIKAGVLLADGLDFSGEVKRVDIGIVLPEKRYAESVDTDEAKSLLPIRKRNSHKGSFGRVAIVAGSAEYTGAAYLSATAAACLRSGAGYVTLFLPQEILLYYVLKTPEILLKSTNEGGRYAFSEENAQTLLSYDAVAFGMGMGCSADVAEGAAYLLGHFQGRLILDADGLNSLARYKKDDFAELFDNKKCDVVLTPHVKEFSRLSGKEVAEIIEEGLTAPCEFAAKYAVNVLLKNASSIVTDGQRIAINTTGNSGLAKGGSGDVLSGVIAGLCAQGVSAFDGARLGAYLVGKAAEFAVQTIGEYSLTATDVVANLGKAFLSLVD
ncbi:MAG: NAD(P)H-hydrate dehydratase [Clostridiales bacterium]|nr:NAD(P)H-hydrate dehydratase [Clostridiales bacterium]